MEQFEAVLEEDSELPQQLQTYTESIECPSDESDLEFEFQMILDDYEVTLFPFENSEPLVAPLMSQRELAIAQEKEQQKLLSETVHDAKFIAIGTLHHIDELPDGYPYDPGRSFGYNFVFESSHGWRKAPPEKFVHLRDSFSLMYRSYLPPRPPFAREQRQENQESNSAELSLRSVVGQKIFVISSQDNWDSLIWEPLEGKGGEYMLSLLGEHEWEWTDAGLKTIDEAYSLK